jgi:hypothetical protein
VTTEDVSKWFDKWISPVTIMSLIGAIIWGVQLNAVALGNSKELAALTAVVSNNVEVNIEQSTQLARIASTLDAIDQRHSETHRHVLEREREAEAWKRKIEANQRQLDLIERQWGN